MPVQPWDDVKDANKNGPHCYQMGEGNEDCLYLSVYTKSLEPDSLLPVMVWVHGGKFLLGSGDDGMYGADYFMRRDIVLVAMNYRLGVFG